MQTRMPSVGYEAMLLAEGVSSLLECLVGFDYALP